MEKLNVQFNYLQLQSLVSHDSSEIILKCWLGAQKYLLLLMLKILCCLIFQWKQWYFSFQDSLFTVTFDPSFTKKGKKKIVLTPFDQLKYNM